MMAPVLRQNGRVMTAMGWNIAGRASGLGAGAAVAAAFTVEPDEYFGVWWRLVLKDSAAGVSARRA
jgi:hypothetical protein